MIRDDEPTLEWCLGCRNRLSDCRCAVPVAIEDPKTVELPKTTMSEMIEEDRT